MGVSSLGLRGGSFEFRVWATGFGLRVGGLGHQVQGLGFTASASEIMAPHKPHPLCYSQFST